MAGKLGKKKSIKNVRFHSDYVSFTIYSKHGEFEVLIDIEDFERVNSRNWSINKSSKNSTYYKVESRSNYKLVTLHRFILDNFDKTVNIDHKNRNPLDNRKDNLRACTQAQNMRNCSTIGNKTGFRGVYKNHSKYRASISINNKTFHIPGNFSTPEEAAKVRDEYALKYSGEFAILNFKKDR